MKKSNFLIVLLFNLILALAFYLEGLKANVTDISGDLANIIPICKKLDNPSLFANDLYLNDVNNVKYYTPFYIETLRYIASFVNFDYVQALNVLGFFTHLCYGIVWFLLFYTVKKDFWLAFLFSIFFRGVVWPPGMELLGISDIWTIMPRTVFIALIPIPFLIFMYCRDKWQYLAPLVLGILVNFHPISGLGCVLVYLSLYILNLYFENKLWNKQVLIKLLFYFIFIVIGMFPYVLSYLTNVKSDVNVNPEMFNEAFRARLNPVFFDAIVFLKSWFKPVTCFFATGFFLFYFFDNSQNKRTFKILFLTIVISLFFCNAIIPVENFINSSFDSKFRFAFQIVRAQKFVLVLLQIGTFFLLCSLAERFRISSKVKILVLPVYLVLIAISSAPFMHKIPLFGEDITTFIFPNNLKFYPIPKEDKSAILAMHDYVNKNTKLNDVFYARDIFFRTATNRAEVLDFHAAGMLIEGNQKIYTDFYFLLQKFKTTTEIEKIEILKSKKVTYIIDKEKWNTLELVFQNSKYYIYKL